MKNMLLLAAIISLHAPIAYPLFFQVQEKTSGSTLCTIADLRAPSTLGEKQSEAEKQGILFEHFDTIIEEMPLFLEMATKDGLPVLILAPEKLDLVSPLDQQAPIIEGARTGLAWARAYYQLLYESNLLCDLHIIKVPTENNSSHQEIFD